MGNGRQRRRENGAGQVHSLVNTFTLLVNKFAFLTSAGGYRRKYPKLDLDIVIFSLRLEGTLLLTPEQLHRCNRLLTHLS